MEHENLNLKEVMESRHHAVEESLRIISVDELKALTDELFPYADHPWLETFLNVVSDPTSGTFHHAVTDDRLDEVKLPIHILYCHDKEIGMWFIRGSGKGPLQPEERFDGITLVGAIPENIVTRRGKPIRIERLGRPEIKNFVLASPMRDPRTKGVELRDLYNKEDAFALSKEYRPLYESRLDANLAFIDQLDGKTAWPLGPDGRHPLRDLLVDDCLILDLAYPLAPGGFLEIERALINKQPNKSAGGRWLDDDILDEMLTLLVNGGQGERYGDGVDAPTKPASLTFPYVREPNNRTDLPLPAFLRGA